jgi:TRAP-type mannitol/chloroaromatic compound transport system substrate-binding protein
MMIDEDRLHVLTNFHPIRKGVRVIESDHNTEILELDLQFDKRNPDRREIFNFKNEECQQTFLEVTSETRKFSECFQTNQSFLDQAIKWNKTLNNAFHLSFRKIRVVEGKPRE